MKLSTIIISIVLIGVLFTGFYSFVNDMASPTAYNVTITDYSGTFDKTNDVSTEINEKYNTLTNWSAEKSTLVSIITFVPDSLSLVKSILTLPFTILHGVVINLTSILHLPDWFSAFLIVLIPIILMFAFITLILRWKS